MASAAKIEKISWSDAIRTGVPMIDVQHRQLIDAINDLGEAINHDRTEKELPILMRFLEDFVDYHFQNEEECAASYQCPNAQKNKQAHDRFRELLQRQKEEVRTSESKSKIAIQIHQDLSDWLVSHIMHIDKQLGECILA